MPDKLNFRFPLALLLESGDTLGDTSTRNTAANDRYERLLTRQKAANLQRPATDPANTALRDKFRLGKFPPRRSSSASPAAPPPPSWLTRHGSSPRPTYRSCACS